MHAVKVAIAGAGGRMGRMLIEAALAPDSGVALAAAFDRPGSPVIGQDVGQLLGRTTGVSIGDDIAAAVVAADCVIDFTRPEGTFAILDEAVRHKRAMVIGTTGFDEAGRDRIGAAARDIPIVFAPNMAVGVNAVFKLLEVAAKLLEGYDVEVIEAHHRHKVDAPSGTALAMGRIVARTLGWSFDAVAIFGREGNTGERPKQQIGFSTIRAGEIIGDHTVLFAAQGERIEITHRSQSRMPYAAGAIRAARFLADKPAGLYSMQDVLGI
ncbi:4-hydroxy-tetrahydrodipicolinate reductase [Hydrogenophilus thermoluteolus]|uniref:4-hydroxy-tetrahydrodipicolinate reductase n=1 Tax=Hydrogenophilus thermoluteolus TaxID=297 RepID=UPI003F6637C9